MQSGASPWTDRSPPSRRTCVHGVASRFPATRWRTGRFFADWRSTPAARCTWRRVDAGACSRSRRMDGVTDARSDAESVVSHRRRDLRNRRLRARVPPHRGGGPACMDTEGEKDLRGRKVGDHRHRRAALTTISLKRAVAYLDRGVIGVPPVRGEGMAAQTPTRVQHETALVLPKRPQTAKHGTGRRAAQPARRRRSPSDGATRQTAQTARRRELPDGENAVRRAVRRFAPFGSWPLLGSCALSEAALSEVALFGSWRCSEVRAVRQSAPFPPPP